MYQKQLPASLRAELLTHNPGAKPWCLIGGFNSIIDTSEKLGANLSTTSHMNAFIDFLNNGNLVGV